MHLYICETKIIKILSRAISTVCMPTISCTSQAWPCKYIFANFWQKTSAVLTCNCSFLSRGRRTWHNYLQLNKNKIMIEILQSFCCCQITALASNWSVFVSNFFSLDGHFEKRLSSLIFFNPMFCFKHASQELY